MDSESYTIAQNFLNRLYNDMRKGRTKTPIFQILYDILQIKKEHPGLRNEHQPMYSDAKEFVIEYIKKTQKRELGAGYDTLNIQKLIDVADFFDDNFEQGLLIDFSIRELANNGYHEEADEIKRRKHRLIIQQCLHSDTVRGKCKGIFLLATLNLWNCLLTIFIVLCFHCLLLLPLSNSDMASFLIEYHPYSENFLLNHILNFMASFIEINDVVFYKATGFVGVIVIMLFKAFYAIFISSFLVDIIKNVLGDDK